MYSKAKEEICLTHPNYFLEGVSGALTTRIKHEYGYVVEYENHSVVQ